MKYQDDSVIEELYLFMACAWVTLHSIGLLFYIL